MQLERLAHRPAPPPIDMTTGRGYFRGRVALAAILRASGIGPGDLVLQQAFTCSAVIEGIFASGARPLFVDVGERSLNMDPQRLPRDPPQNLRAIIVQHSFGIPADMDEILAYAEAHELLVIEDCCHAVASRHKGRSVGSFGAAAFHSFEYGKPLVAGLGGWAVANGEELSEKLERDYRNYSEPSLRRQLTTDLAYQAYRLFYSPTTYWIVRGAYRLAIEAGIFEYAHVSGNSLGFDRPTEDFSLRLGRIQRKRLAADIERHAAAAATRKFMSDRYEEALKGSERLVAVPAGAAVDYLRFPVLVADKERTLDAARAARLEITHGYASPVHPYVGPELAGIGYSAGDCPNAERLIRSLTFLPTSARLEQADIEKLLALLDPKR